MNIDQRYMLVTLVVLVFAVPAGLLTNSYKTRTQVKVTIPASTPPQVPTVVTEAPKPPPPAPPPPPYTATGCEQYRPLVQQYDWDVNIAMAIMEAESNCRSNAVSPPNWNGTHDYGLFQLNQISVLDPVENIKIAYYKKYKTPQGWRHWTVYNTGKYLQYL